MNSIMSLTRQLMDENVLPCRLRQEVLLLKDQLKAVLLFNSVVNGR